MKCIYTILLFSILSTINSFAQAPQTGDFQGYSGSLYLGAETTRYSTQMTERLLYGDTGFSVSVAHSDYDYDEDGAREVEGEYDTSYASLAYSYQFEHFSLGAAVTGVDADFESSGTTNPAIEHEMEADGFLGTLAASTEISGFVVGLQTTFGELSFDSSRVNGFPFPPRRGDFDVSIFQVELSAFYDFSKSDDYSITPYAKLGFVDLEADAFDETVTVGADVARFDSFNDNHASGEIGLRFGLLSLDYVVPYLNLSLWQDLGDDEIELTGFDAAGNRFDGANTLRDPDIAQTVARGEVGFNWAVSESIDIGASFTYADGDAYDGYSAMLSFNWGL